ncbi:MAG: hypothetical protein IJR99_12955 [Kiritimatiellae bacterium]|nr:hypothetical protein [Kiritimatiellia bacterium]
MMEFVLVLPLYLFLLGSVFLLGDMGIKVGALAIGDRTVAMDAGDRKWKSYSPFKTRQFTDSGLQTPRTSTYRVDKDFTGAWYWFAGGLELFDYKLPGWFSGLIAYPYYRYGNISSDGFMRTLVNNGRVEVRSKKIGSERSYSYYALKRTELARKAGAYRNWMDCQIVDCKGSQQFWYEGVFKEGIYKEPLGPPNRNDTSAEKLDADGPRQGSDALPSMPSGYREYDRFSGFVNWSE